MRARRDALARRLLGGRAPGHASSTKMKAVTQAQIASGQAASPQAAMDALKRRYEDRTARAKATQAKHYAETGDKAMATNDPIAAANAYRVAVTLAPDDADLRARAEVAQRAADEVLSETYERQAIYEEKSERWADAARSWARVVRARPKDARAHDRAAGAMAKSGGDLHEAARLAKIACALMPRSGTPRRTLAEVYIAAGLTLNAKRELEAAAQLSPNDVSIAELLKRL
jgi:hypothetical protein